jgi:hypothetical protein
VAIYQPLSYSIKELRDWDIKTKLRERERERERERDGYLLIVKTNSRNSVTGQEKILKKEEKSRTKQTPNWHRSSKFETI